ncbi:MAG: UbiA family prenyltransferase [Desulfovibrio sp.]|jgi:4-hydroxybenzoate polyprenyltransferase/phosphoglycolate phosphatase-like HAD superfamily hydrolase|nr:UbiA family prenyltransferase [Desulfovibrio sp.]
MISTIPSTTLNPPIPLVTDLDGTLIKTDSLWEGFYALLATRPWRTLLIPFWLFSGITVLKSMLSEYSLKGVTTWPLNDAVLGELQKAQNEGRPIYLATAADRRIAEAVAARMDCFAGVFASDGVNLKGSPKAELLCSYFGASGFDYIGDSNADIPVWKSCREALYVGSGDAMLLRAVKKAGVTCRCLDSLSPVTLRVYLKGLRVAQWAKNVLIFAPMFLAHQFTLKSILLCCIAALAFCACASSAYILNDLLDLPADRSHTLKKARPFAAGLIPLWQGPPLILLGLCVGALCTLFLPPPFGIVLIGYYLLTLFYSFRLKRLIFIDIIVLASLYCIRMGAGAATLALSLSNWALSFSFFIFLGLALIKRVAEFNMRTADGDSNVRGRAYIMADKSLLETMTVCAGFSAEIILMLYIDSLNALSLYSKPWLLWMLCPTILYWYGRMLFIMHRGKMLDDPVIFVLTDKNSLACITIGVLVTIASI